MSIQRHATATQLPPSARQARVVPFIRRDLPDNELAMRDRIELLRWAEAAQEGGLRRYAVHHREEQDDPETVGDFVLIYREDADWAEWGVARSGRSYMVWRSANGRTTGLFDSLAEALQTIYPG
jgi:hypothetical protein